jgi:hypothetical protein
MKSDPSSRHQARLDRAAKITGRLAATRDTRDLAQEISKALRPQLDQSRYSRLPLDYLLEPPVSKKSSATKQDLVFLEGICLTVKEPGGLRGIHKLEDLVAEFVTAFALPPSASGKKQKARPPFAFFLGALSAMASREDTHNDLVQICKAGRDEAVELAAAAAHHAHSPTFRDMQQGFAAVAEVEHRRALFGQQVAAVWGAYRGFVEKGHPKPTKSEVRKAAILHLSKNKIKHPADSDSASWRRIYKGAGLPPLPQIRVGRGPSRHRKG